MLAVKAHRGYTDKAGAPYILHPLRVMLKMDTDIEKQAAVLHDVVEDTKISIQDLAKDGYSKDVIHSVGTLSKTNEEEPYDEYINRLKDDPIARKVKLADLEDNMDLSRIEAPTEKDFERIEKYKIAFKQLKQEKKYCVYVDDNFHYQDESERYLHGIYDSCEKAIKVCKDIVDDYFRKLPDEDLNEEKLWDSYASFGEDPFITVRDGDNDCSFSAWNYAKRRIKELIALNKGNDPD